MSDLVTAALAFLGAAIGSVLAFFGAQTATRADREARRREEWGLRFSSALEAITSADRVSRALGRALLVELLDSELATADDRRAAQAVLEAAATQDLRLRLPADDLADVEVVRDTGLSEPEGATG